MPVSEAQTALQKENRELSKSLRRALNDLMDRRLAKLISKEEFDSEREALNAQLDRCHEAHQQLNGRY
jgi:BMFP domain-containing protein YqiC